MSPRLDRLPPKTWKHVERFPLTVAPSTPVPIAFGVNWYSNFDSPVRDGRTYWIGRGDLGSIRGGHCVCLPSAGRTDPRTWWDFYDQGQEGACVGFGCSRVMSLLNRRRYDARWLYHEAQKIDEWAGEDYEGTTVSAGLEVLRTQGHRVIRGSREASPNASEGIAAYRWITDWDEVRRVLGVTKPGVPLLNSWGESFPHVVRLTDEAGARLLAEDGECGVPTDR